MDFQKVEKSILGISTRSLVTGVTGTLVSNYYLPGGTINVMGYNIPVWAFYMGVYTGAAGLNQATKELLYDKSPEMLKPVFALGPVNTGVAASVLAYGINLALGGNLMPTARQLVIPFGIGAGADLLGSYVTNNLVDPILDVKKIKDANNQLVPPEHEVEDLSLDPTNFNRLLDIPFLSTNVY